MHTKLRRTAVYAAAVVAAVATPLVATPLTPQPTAANAALTVHSNPTPAPAPLPIRKAPFPISNEPRPVLDGDAQNVAQARGVDPDRVPANGVDPFISQPWTNTITDRTQAGLTADDPTAGPLAAWSDQGGRDAGIPIIVAGGIGLAVSVIGLITVALRRRRY